MVVASLGKVLQILSNNVNPANYVKNIMFLVGKNSVYIAAALVNYDTAMRDRAELTGMHTFTYGDHELVHRHLGLEKN